MNRLLERKVALVTGAGSGIGRATVLKFAQAGARIVAADIGAGSAEETAAMARALGAEAVATTVDVARSDEVQAMVALAVSTFGRLDCAFNNAGIARNPGGEWDEDWWDQVMAVNLKGVMLGMKFELEQMARQGGGGAIVNTASVAGLISAGGLAYTASKHAVIGLTRAAAARVSKDGIRVNAVCPGVTQTPLIEAAERTEPGSVARTLAPVPAGRAASPDEIADAVLWLCSDHSTYVMGHPLVVDGAMVAV